jgi:hypothetical protein
MADIKFLVSIDTKTGQAQLKEFADSIDGLGKSADKTKGKHDELGKNVKESIGIFGSAKEAFLKQVAAYATGQAVFAAAQKALRTVVDVVKDSIAAAIEDERIEKALTSAIKTTGSEAALSARKFIERAMALERMTKYDHDAIIQVQTLLVQMTHLSQDGIDRATKASMGLATVMGIDLQTSGMMVMKAMEGSLGALSRYGIKVNESLSPMQKQADILNQLEKMFGRATDETETMSGKMAQLKNAVDKAKETLGGIVVGSKAVKDAFDGIRAAVDLLNEKFSQGGNFLDVLARYIPVLKSFQTQFRILTVLAAEQANNLERSNDAVKGGYVAYNLTIKALDKLGIQVPGFIKDLGRMSGGARDAGVSLAGVQKIIKETGDENLPRFRVAFAQGIAFLQVEFPALANTVMTASRNMAGHMMFAADKMASHALPVKKAWEQAAREIAQVWESTMQQIQQAVMNVTGQIGAIAQQGYTNQVTRIENEYALKKKYVLATVKDEVQKNAALEVLDQKMELEKRGAMRRYAAAQKAVALANAVVNTAEGVTKALASAPPPFNVILAAITAALGAVQVGMIAAQPLPLAKGAIFNRRTLLTSERGSQYEVAEAGEPEILASPRQLRQAIAGSGRASGSGQAGRPVHIHLHNYIGMTKIKEEIHRVIMDLDAEGKLRLRRAVA